MSRESTDDTAIRTLRITRTRVAPAWEVWEAWTNPECIVRRWRQQDFTTTTFKMNVQEGGEWMLTLHGPDGAGYPNRSIFRTIIPLRKIVFEHFNPDFTAMVRFESGTWGTTMNREMRFGCSAMHDIVVKAHHAAEGQTQTVDRLEKYLAKMLSF